MLAFPAFAVVLALLGSGGRPPSWMSAWNGPASRTDFGSDVAVDRTGRPVLFGTTDYDSGKDDFSVVAYDLDGSERWSATWDGPGHGIDYCWTGVVDSKGRPVAMGEGIGLDGSTDSFVLGYSRDGALRWTYTGAGAAGGYDGTSAAYSIAIDAEDDVVFSHYEWTATRDYDVTTVKLDPHGKVLWKHTFDAGFGLYDAPYGVEVDDAGNAYVQITSYSAASSSYDLGVLKYSPDGQLLWSTLVPNPNDDLGYVIAVDRWHDVYVGGISSAPGKSDDVLIARIAADGTLVWDRTWDSSIHGDDLVFEAVAHPQGGAAFCGTTSNGLQSSIVTLRYDRDGTLVFSGLHDLANEWIASDSASAVDCDALGNVYVTGFGWNTMARGFDGVNLKYSPTGTLLEENLVDSGLGDNEMLFGMAIGGSRLYAAGIGQTARGDADALLLSWTLPAWYTPQARTH